MWLTLKLPTTGNLNGRNWLRFRTWNMNFQVPTFVEIVGKVHFMFGVSVSFTTGWMFISTPQDDCFLQTDCEIVAAERYLVFATKRFGYFSLQNDGDLTTERLPEDRMETCCGPFFGQCHPYGMSVAESRQYSGSSPNGILLVRWFEEHESYRMGSSITTLSHLSFFCSFWQDGWRLCEETDEPAPMSSVIFHYIF